MTEQDHAQSWVNKCPGRDSKQPSSECESEPLLLQSTFSGETRYFNSQLELVYYKMPSFQPSVHYVP